MSGWLAFFGVFAVFAGVLWALVRGASVLREEIERLEKEAWENVQDDVHLRDVVLANSIRERVADVSDGLPSVGTDEAEAKPETKRRGRRGPV